jgi:hypothetical protein
MTAKIERSGILPVSHRSGQAARDLYSRAVVDTVVNFNNSKGVGHE